MTTVDVTGERPYRVFVGRDLLAEIPPLLGPAAQVAVLFSAPLRGYADRVMQTLRADGRVVLPIEVPDAEAGKSLDVAARCWDALGGARFTRTDAVLGVGGGAVTDLAGFVAACWLRGVAAVQVPTSLLGMVDAAVGGKTGVNTAAGKNLVGAFHPPAGVVCDLSTLDTLPPADFTAGLAEVIKCGFIADPVILELIESGPEIGPAAPVLPELVERAVRVKAEVVGADLRESGRREILNYGHTLAHAIERTSDYAVRHGEAVAIGCVYVAELAARAGSLDPALVERHRAAFARVGLPTTYDAASFDDLHAAMKVDKKARGSQLRFVVLDDLTTPRILAGPSEDDLRAAYAAIASPA
jgi:3-dehydroquinate synthase